MGLVGGQEPLTEVLQNHTHLPFCRQTQSCVAGASAWAPAPWSEAHVYSHPMCVRISTWRSACFSATWWGRTAGTWGREQQGAGWMYFPCVLDALDRDVQQISLIIFPHLFSQESAAILSCCGRYWNDPQVLFPILTPYFPLGSLKTFCALF